MTSQRFLSQFVLVLVFATLDFVARAEDTAPIRTGWAEVKCYSIDPTKGLESYRPGSSGGTGLGGTFGATVQLTDATLTINVSARQRGDKFVVELKTDKAVGNEVTSPPELNREIDFTDLAPFACELGRDPNGRVHRLTIVPVVRSQPLPKQFRLADLDLTDFNLSSLPVILNEQEFIGTAGVDGGEVISLGIAGLADIEFSLRPFTGAIPTGELYSGTLTIRHDKDQLQISGVTNGERKESLVGGPYIVFVRWEAPQMSLPQYVGFLQKQLEEFHIQAERGDLHAKLLLPKLQTMTVAFIASTEMKSRTASLYSSGARQLSSKERSDTP
ncbi:MAG TPA: hypothetical protein VGN12_26070 [Pirellulales bacterium]|jgi:hypothetical protein